jgi:3-dehydroquinate dehydratase type I
MKRIRNPFGATNRATPVLIVPPVPRGRQRSKSPSAVEVRLDLFQRPPGPERVADLLCQFRKMGSAVLLTARRVADGGCWPKRNEAARRDLLLACAGLVPDAIDIETDLLADPRFRRALASVRAKKTAIIASLHRFRPLSSIALLDREATCAARRGADRFKAAITVTSMNQSVKLADWALERDPEELPVTVIAMGEAGSWTRWVLPKILGGPAYAPAGHAIAPGQISYRKLAALIAS